MLIDFTPVMFDHLLDAFDRLDRDFLLLSGLARHLKCCRGCDPVVHQDISRLVPLLYHLGLIFLLLLEFYVVAVLVKVVLFDDANCKFLVLPLAIQGGRSGGAC